MLTKKTWIEALRSGTYTQATGALYNTGRGDEGYNKGYCCLGVAARLADFSQVRLEGISDLSRFSIDDNASFPPQIMRHEAELVTLNDDKRLTFHQIAHWIEENVEDF